MIEGPSQKKKKKKKEKRINIKRGSNKKNKKNTRIKSSENHQIYK